MMLEYFTPHISAMARNKNPSTEIRIPGFLTMFRICEVLGVFPIVYNPNKLHSKGEYFINRTSLFVFFCPVTLGYYGRVNNRNNKRVNKIQYDVHGTDKKFRVEANLNLRHSAWHSRLKARESLDVWYSCIGLSVS